MRLFYRLVICICVFVSALTMIATGVFSAEPSNDLSPKPPEGAVILFDADGTTDQFFSKTGGKPDWKVEKGELIATPGTGIKSNHISSKLHFQDAKIHAEFCDSEIAEGNSGIYLHGLYEAQIFNSHGKENPTHSDCGAIYGISAPKVNAALPPGQWQTYDIIFIAPRRDADGKVIKPGFVTSWLNGKLVQDKTEIRDPVSKYHPYRWQTTPFLGRVKSSLEHTGIGPVFLQEHASPVRFRNVWVKPLDDKARFYEDKVEVPTEGTTKKSASDQAE